MKSTGTHHASLTALAMAAAPAANVVADPADGIQILAGRPPNFKEICRVFPQSANKGTIFTYGKVIYVSDGSPLPRSLIAHEVIHVQQQEVMGAVEWWDRYLHDAKFRFGQELAAHRQEYVVACLEGGRTHRRVALAKIAQRLSGPLYGRCVTMNEAKLKIKASNDAK